MVCLVAARAAHPVGAAQLVTQGLRDAAPGTWHGVSPPALGDQWLSSAALEEFTHGDSFLKLQASQDVAGANRHTWGTQRKGGEEGECWGGGGAIEASGVFPAVAGGVQSGGAAPRAGGRCTRCR